MFYFFDVEFNDDVQRHIIEPLNDGGVRSFPMTDDNPNMVAYLAWVAEGNTPEEWQPETEPASEPVIEEEPSDSTDEEPVTEDAN